MFSLREKRSVAGLSFLTKGEKVKLAKGISSFLGFKDFAYLEQIHSGKVVEVEDSPVKGIEGDALFTFKKGVLLNIFTADCVPVYVYGDGFVGIIHAGWRGFVNRVFENFFNEIKGKGVKVERLNAFVGVSICGNCYEVGEDVADYFSGNLLKKKANGKFLLDLKGAAFEKLVENGLKRERVMISQYCTKHHHYFHSYRRDKSGFRNVNFIGIRGD